jgi:hypothetical protein
MGWLSQRRKRLDGATKRADACSPARISGLPSEGRPAGHTALQQLSQAEARCEPHDILGIHHTKCDGEEGMLYYMKLRHPLRSVSSTDHFGEIKKFNRTSWERESGARHRIDGRTFGCLIDQTRLPMELVETDCQDVPTVWEAIKALRVRGAPAIGVAVAYGAVIVARDWTPAVSSREHQTGFRRRQGRRWRPFRVARHECHHDYIHCGQESDFIFFIDFPFQSWEGVIL